MDYFRAQQIHVVSLVIVKDVFYLNTEVRKCYDIWGVSLGQKRKKNFLHGMSQNILTVIVILLFIPSIVFFFLSILVVLSVVFYPKVHISFYIFKV